MCGIVGICNLNELSEVSVAAIERMISVQHHRGPDEAGIYLDDWAGLGHTRLSIIDLSSGMQPIHNEDETLWIIYNGEVFNYPELRRDLLQKGHRFYTATDTEVNTSSLRRKRARVPASAERPICICDMGCEKERNVSGTGQDRHFAASLHNTQRLINILIRN